MNKNEKQEKTIQRLYCLIDLQKRLVSEFGGSNYNVFVFGSYITVYYIEGKSDIDIAVYTEDFNIYKKISAYISNFFDEIEIPCDIFYIDTSMVAPVYCAPLSSKIQFTDYYPNKLTKFYNDCKDKLEAIKAEIKD